MTDFDTVDDNAGNRIEGGNAAAVLEYIAKSIVDDADAVSVSIDNNGGATQLNLAVAPDDKGKIIGKRGRVVTSMRTVVRAVGARDNENVNVEVEDD